MASGAEQDLQKTTGVSSGAHADRTASMKAAVATINQLAADIKSVPGKITWSGTSSQAAADAFATLSSQLAAHADTLAAVDASDAAAMKTVTTAQENYHALPPASLGQAGTDAANKANNFHPDEPSGDTQNAQLAAARAQQAGRDKASLDAGMGQADAQMRSGVTWDMGDVNNSAPYQTPTPPGPTVAGGGGYSPPAGTATPTVATTPSLTGLPANPDAGVWGTGIGTGIGLVGTGAGLSSGSGSPTGSGGKGSGANADGPTSGTLGSGTGIDPNDPLHGLTGSTGLGAGGGTGGIGGTGGTGSIGSGGSGGLMGGVGGIAGTGGLLAGGAGLAGGIGGIRGSASGSGSRVSRASADGGVTGTTNSDVAGAKPATGGIGGGSAAATEGAPGGVGGGGTGGGMMGGGGSGGGGAGGGGRSGLSGSTSGKYGVPKFAGESEQGVAGAPARSTGAGGMAGGRGAGGSADQAERERNFLTEEDEENWYDTDVAGVGRIE